MPNNSNKSAHFLRGFLNNSYFWVFFPSDNTKFVIIRLKLKISILSKSDTTILIFSFQIIRYLKMHERGCTMLVHSLFLVLYNYEKKKNIYRC